MNTFEARGPDKIVPRKSERETNTSAPMSNEPLSNTARGDGSSSNALVVPFDKAAYQREYMRKRRAEKKAQPQVNKRMLVHGSPQNPT
jgi:hypothetical protein